jgi:hypothetical protein
MRKCWIPIRSGFIILAAEIAEELIRTRSFNSLIDASPYVLGVSLAFVAVEYARLYHIQTPTAKNKKAFMPLVWA